MKTIRYFSLVLTLLAGLTGRGMAQILSPDCWHPGQVVLASEDTLTGFLKYQFDQDLLLVKIGGNISTYAPNQVGCFSFTDSLTQKYRSIVVKNYETSRDYFKPFFFEELVRNGQKLYGREYISLESRGNLATQGFNTTYRTITYSYYVEYSGKVKHFINKKKIVLDILNDQAVPLDRFRKENRLRYGIHTDLIRIFEHYNQLKKDDEGTRNSRNE